jgi:hypothetical protein
VLVHEVVHQRGRDIKAKRPLVNELTAEASQPLIQARSGRDYQECIGAKKHLVLGLLSHGPKTGSTAFTHG